MKSLKNSSAPCFCGSTKTYQNCCEPLHLGAQAHYAEALMRSRYSAYVLGLEAYLLDTWHPDTRPILLNLADDAAIKWQGLNIIHAINTGECTATVEFTAHYKINGKKETLHETSQFVFAHQWLYLNGNIKIN